MKIVKHKVRLAVLALKASIISWFAVVPQEEAVDVLRLTSLEFRA